MNVLYIIIYNLWYFLRGISDGSVSLAPRTDDYI